MAFEAWFREHGGRVHPSAEINITPQGNCLSVRPGDIITPKSCVINCPRNLIMFWAHAREPRSIMSKLISMYSTSSRGQTIATRLFLMGQYMLKEDSFWWPYISDCLPKPDPQHAFNTASYFDHEDLIWLRGTNLEKAMEGRRTMWHREYEEAMGLLFGEETLEEPSKERERWTWLVKSETLSKPLEAKYLVKGTLLVVNNCDNVEGLSGVCAPAYEN